MDTNSLHAQLLQAQQDLAASLAAELHYGCAAREYRAEASNLELSFHQREAQHRAYIQMHGQYVGQRAETTRLQVLVARLQRLIQEDRDMAALSNAEFLARVQRSQPFTLSPAMAEGMDLTLEAAQ